MSWQPVRDQLLKMYSAVGIAEATGRTYVDRILSERMVYSVAAESAAGDTTTDFFLDYFPGAREIVSVSLLPNGTVTANDTNYATITIETGSTTIAEVTTETTGSGGTGDWAAGTAITTTLSAENLAAAGSLKYSVAKAASGVQLPQFQIVAVWG